MAVEDLLVQTCTIKRETTTVGTRGQTDVVWTTVATDVKCNVQLATIVREEYQALQHGRTTLTTFLGFFEFGTDILEGDKVFLDSPSTIFQVDRVHPDSVGRSSHIEADIEKVDY